MRNVIYLLFKIIEILLLPLTLITALWTRVIVSIGLHRTLLAKKIFLAMGFLPIRDHYYQPLINPAKHLRHPLDKVRELPGLDFNTATQLDLLNKFNVNSELESFLMRMMVKRLSFIIIALMLVAMLNIFTTSSGTSSLKRSLK
jgi:hypothetical protein